jgi:uncharacterized protein YecT (DUF1311 family)
MALWSLLIGMPASRAAEPGASAGFDAMVKNLSTRPFPEADAALEQLIKCWNVPASVANSSNTKVQIDLDLNPDGSRTAANISNLSPLKDDNSFRDLAQSAMRAINNPSCSQFQLPSERYESWKHLVIVFDPHTLEAKSSNANVPPPPPPRPQPLPAQAGAELPVIRQLNRCWNPPAGVRNLTNPAVEIQADFNKDGSVNSVTITDQSRYANDENFRALADSAVRAVKNPSCLPIHLPEDKYESWKHLNLTFIPDLSSPTVQDTKTPPPPTAQPPLGEGLAVTVTPSRSDTALIVTGEIRNEAKGAREVPKIRVSLRDANKNDLASQVLDPPTEHLSSGATATFSTQFPSTPQATGVDVTFVSKQTVAGMIPESTRTLTPNRAAFDKLIRNLEQKQSIEADKATQQTIPPVVAGNAAPPPPPPPPPPRPRPERIGPSFDCQKVKAPLAQIICADPELSALDVRFVDAYKKLLSQLSGAAASQLKQEDSNFISGVQKQCGIPTTGTPNDTPQMRACIKTAYEKQRQAWLSRLSGLASEEVTQPAIPGPSQPSTSEIM